MGSAACYHLARRGLSVLGLEQFDLSHDRGSSHGRSRVIRKAYFEDPRYVPLLHRTYALWRLLEAACGERLMHLAGVLNLGPPDHVCIQGAQRSAEEHGLPHEALDAREVHRRWPGLVPNEGDVGLFESDAGFLLPELCCAAHVRLAREHGARIEARQKVLRWSADHSGVTVETDGERFEATYLVITAGAWLPEVVRQGGGNEGRGNKGGGSREAAPANAFVHGGALTVERQVQAWFRPRDPALFRVGRLPAFVHFLNSARDDAREGRTAEEHPLPHDRGSDNPAAFYAIPALGEEGVKVARHHGGAVTTAEAVDRSFAAADEQEIRRYLARHLPQADGPVIDAKICLYTNTPDDHFILDRHPSHSNVLIAGGFSGHGFKFAPVVGEVLADLIVEGRTGHPIEFLGARRLDG